MCPTHSATEGGRGRPASVLGTAAASVNAEFISFTFPFPLPRHLPGVLLGHSVRGGGRPEESRPGRATSREVCGTAGSSLREWPPPPGGQREPECQLPGERTCDMLARSGVPGSAGGLWLEGDGLPGGFAWPVSRKNATVLGSLRLLAQVAQAVETAPAVTVSCGRGHVPPARWLWVLGDRLARLPCGLLVLIWLQFSFMNLSVSVPEVKGKRNDSLMN